MFGTAYVRWDAPGYHQSTLPLDFPYSQNFQIIAPSSGPERSSKPLWDWNFEGQPTYYGVLRWATSKPYVSRMHITLTCPVAYLCKWQIRYHPDGALPSVLILLFASHIHLSKGSVYKESSELCTSPSVEIRPPRQSPLMFRSIIQCPNGELT